MNSALGFANALSFKDVDEADITLVEEYIKFDALKEAAAQLEQSVEGDYESVSFCLQHDQLVEIFGNVHASNPSQFKFERGDRVRIRNLVEYVKDVVDGGGKLKGLGYFEMKRKTKSTKSLITLRKPRTLSIHTHQIPKKSIGELKSELHRRITDVLKSHGININNLDDDMVNVEPNGVIGLVNCVVCKNGSKKKLRPKRVYYKSKSNTGYWVVANFDAHIKRVHKSSLHGSTAIEEKKLLNTNQIESVSAMKSNSDLKNDNIELSTSQSNLTQNDDQMHSNDQTIPAGTESNVKVEIIQIDSDADLTVLDEPDKYEEELSIDKQISAQIIKMMGSVLMNGDVQTQMAFQLNENDQIRHLSTVKMNADGDCLFSSLCHQRFRHRANSKQHIEETNQLRADVVAHILKPENFPKFKFTLQDHVYERKLKSQITDMEAECKHFVRDVLSKRGVWGGMETIKAASDIFECNILVYNEHGSCTVTRNSDRKYSQTLIIAYRYMKIRGEEISCHYDSVTDLDPASIIATAQVLPIF